MKPAITEKQLFSGNASFFFAFAKADAPLPDIAVPEFVFAGRSNVGKSSLINAVTGQKKLARASSTPGCTQQINFFSLREAAVITDIPGYGYAKASGQSRERWRRLIENYFERRKGHITRLYLLIDARRGVKEQDEGLAEYMNALAVPFRCVITKCDKAKKDERAKAEADAAGLISRYGAALPDIFFTSAKSRDGAAALRKEITEAAREYAQRQTGA